MKLISAIFAGCVLGAIAAIASVVSGYGALAAFAAYVLLGMIGTLLVAIINWTRLLPFARQPGERRQDTALELAEPAAARSGS